MNVKQPFLSIVITCYNSGKYIDRVLESIVKIKHVDLEVIIVDDCSTESYEDKLEKFDDKLNIRFFKNSRHCGTPANGRELGASVAEGMYLTFLDHDDRLIPEAISKVKSFIIRNDYPEYVISGIRGVDSNGETTYEKYESLTYLHGKFFNMDKFYRKADLHFKKDMYYIEDQYLCALISCNLAKYDIAPAFFNVCTYEYITNDNSISHVVSEREEKTLKEVYRRMCVYVETNYDTLIKFYKNGDLPEIIAKEWLVRSICQLYFEWQELTLRNPERFIDSYDEAKFKEEESYYKDIKSLIAKQVLDIKNLLKMNNKDVMDAIYSDDCRIYYDEYINSFLDHVELNIESIMSEFLQDMVPDETNISNFDKPILISIIVSCYNSRKYIGKLLDSIDKCDNKILFEVILVDNYSTEYYGDIVDKYKEKFTIKETKTDKHSKLSVVRELGASIAIGRYITFVDHDDEIIPDGIKCMLFYMIKDDPLYIISDVENKTSIKLSSVLHLYGKFFNRKDFYEEYNIHFNHDLKYFEDLYVNTLATCIMAMNNTVPHVSNCNTYVFNNAKDHLENISDMMIRDMLNEFIAIRKSTIFKYYDGGKLSHTYTADFLTVDILNLYFKSLYHYDKFEYVKDIIANYISYIKKELKVTNEDIFSYATRSIYEQQQPITLFKTMYDIYMNTYNYEKVEPKIEFNSFIALEGNDVQSN